MTIAWLLYKYVTDSGDIYRSHLKCLVGGGKTRYNAFYQQFVIYFDNLYFVLFTHTACILYILVEERDTRE